MPRKHAKQTAVSGEVRIISGKYRGRKLAVRNQLGLRPTGDRVRETLFNWLQSDINGANCLDLFAGSGALGFEAASRGAASVTCIDTEAANIKLIQTAAQTFGATDIQTYCGDALAWLRQSSATFNIIFIDPPFATDLLQKSLECIENHAGISNETLIYLEASRNQDITLPAGWQWLRHKTTGDVQYGLTQRPSS